jgi:uncharacterized membrane protein HdeD (DUF308 family)
MSEPGTLEVESKTAVPAGVVIGVAVAALVLGAAILAWTGVTLVVVATLFGFHLVMLAGAQLAVASRGQLPTGVRVLVGAMGSYLLVIGLICLFSPFTSIRLLAVLTAIGWIADSLARLAVGRRQRGRARTGLLLSAGLSLAGALANAVAGAAGASGRLAVDRFRNRRTRPDGHGRTHGTQRQCAQMCCLRNPAT